MGCFRKLRLPGAGGSSVSVVRGPLCCWVRNTALAAGGVAGWRVQAGLWSLEGGSAPAWAALWGLCDEPRPQACACSGPPNGQRLGIAVRDTSQVAHPQLVPVGKLGQGWAWAGLTTDNAHGEAWEETEMDRETPPMEAQGEG